MLVLKKELYLDQLKGIEDYSNVWKNEKIPNFEKRHFRTTKRPKRQGTPTQICSMSFSDKINFYDFLKDKYVSETFILYLDNWETFDRKLFLRNGWTAKGDQPYFQPRPLSDSHFANLWHPAIRIWSWEEPELRLCWMKLCSCVT